MTREEFQIKAEELAELVRSDIVRHSMDTYDKMTEEERGRFCKDDENTYLFPRAVGLAVADTAVEWRYDVKAIKGWAARIKRIMNKARYR